MEKTLRKNLQSILLRYRFALFRALVMLVIANGLLVIIPLVFRQAVLQLDPQRERLGEVWHSMFSFLLWGHMNSVYAWAVLLLFLSLAAAYFKYHMRFAFISVSRDAERDLRSLLFSKIQKQSMSFYDRHATGELLSRFTNDLSAYRDVLGPGLMYPLLFITMVFPGLFALFLLSSTLAAVSLFPLFAVPLLNFAMRHPIYQASHQAQKGLADLSNSVQEHYSGIRVVKGYRMESLLVELFGRLTSHLIKVHTKLNTFQGLLFPFFTFLTKMVTVVLVMTAGVIFFNSSANRGIINTADFLTFMWIQSYIFFPVLMLAWMMPIYARGRAAYERLLEIYEEPIEVKNERITQKVISKKADIAFEHLTFSYPGVKRKVLNDFNLFIKSGTFVGITGPVGAGKTTLFRLLNREYEIPHGMIKIGGYGIHDYPLEAFGKEIATVEQLPFLFSGTIADNVRFGKEKADLGEVQLVASYADLHETVLDFPEQYETIVGEKGVTLSGGQKQRVAIARAFLVNRAILLLDDLFSAVDSATEARIFEAIESNFKDKTVLLITHRLSVLELMDRVVYMEDGQVVEEGTPEELRKLNGKYAAMRELQKLGNK